MTVINGLQVVDRRHTLRGVTSYAHADGVLATQLHQSINAQLPPGQPIAQLGGCRVDHWTDRQILTGERWFDRIEDAFTSADFAFLMLSLRFFASEFITNHERRMLAHLIDQNLVIPVALGPINLATAADWGIDHAQIFFMRTPTGGEKTFADVSGAKRDEFAIRLVDDFAQRCEGEGWF